VKTSHFLNKREEKEKVSHRYLYTRKYMHAETLALLTKPLYFPNMKYLK
jgi:hypothetical protein